MVVFKKMGFVSQLYFPLSLPNSHCLSFQLNSKLKLNYNETIPKIIAEYGSDASADGTGCGSGFGSTAHDS